MLELYDSISLGELTSHEIEIFRVNAIGERPYEYYDQVHTSINYEMNLNRVRISRTVFSSFDLIGDIGGM